MLMVRCSRGRKTQEKILYVLSIQNQSSQILHQQRKSRLYDRITNHYMDNQGPERARK